MSEINIRELTTAAEQGRGCDIKTAIESIDFIESMKTLKSITEQNVKDRDDDPTIIRVWDSHYGSSWESSGALHSNRPQAHFWQVETLVTSKLITQDEDNRHMGDRVATCSNADSGDSKTKQ